MRPNVTAAPSQDFQEALSCSEACRRVLFVLCLYFSPLRACKRAFQRGPPDDSQACLGTADVPQTRVDCETIDACAALLAAITAGTKQTEQHIGAECFTGRAKEWPRGEREEKRKKCQAKSREDFA